MAAPCRADLAGGTLDIWPLGLLHTDAVTVNMAIPVEVELIVSAGGDDGCVELITIDGDKRTLGAECAASDLTAAVVFALVPKGGVRVSVQAQAPLCSGLGGSSAYGVALARAIYGLLDCEPSERRLVGLVRDLEARVLSAPTGEQDHWAALRGGVLAVHPEPGGTCVEPLPVDPAWLGERVTVFYSGVRHSSGMVNWQVIRRRLDGDDETRTAFDQIAAAARRCRAGLLAADADTVGDAIATEWDARRRLAPEVSTPELDALVGAARSRGATAVKACGAGGGGSILVWHPPGARDAIVDALLNKSPAGGVVASGAASQGCRLVVA